MARFLIATIPAAGHVNPALPIARFLVERSHEVWWYTGKGFKEKVEATGAYHVPIRTGLDFTDMSTIPQSWLDQKEANLGWRSLSSTSSMASSMLELRSY
jgi:UDP:flavonoid glycosyltransferase YjiC (YdhE family)